MKKILLLLLCCITFTHPQNGEQSSTQTITGTNKLSHALVAANKKPTEELLRLLHTTHIAHNNTLESILANTKEWLRPAGQERWENQKTFAYTYAELSPLLANLYLIQAIRPLQQEYTYVLFFGGCLSDVRNRLAYLIQAWQSGVRFKNIIILTGQRSLDKHIENAEKLALAGATAPLLATETDMIQLLFDQTAIPEEWHTLPIIFVDTPLQQASDGTMRRPNTLDTIEFWINTNNPQPGSILAISNQPFVGYQNSILKSALPKNFSIETIGDEIDANNKTLATILDSLVRWIYVEKHSSK